MASKGTVYSDVDPAGNLVQGYQPSRTKMISITVGGTTLTLSQPNITGLLTALTAFSSTGVWSEMPFPLVAGRTFQQNYADIRRALAADFAPKIGGRTFKQNLDDLFTQVDIVSTQLFDDVQALKAWRALIDSGYMPTDPFAGMTA